MGTGSGTEREGAYNGDIDGLIREAVFGGDDSRGRAREEIRKAAAAHGIRPASIQSLYEAAGRGLYGGITVPAINIRGITYDVARAVFRAAHAGRVGPLIFEIARSEIGYTDQRPAEYAACILAAAIKEGHTGPIFIQGDHFQANRERYRTEPEAELGALADLIREAVAAGFLNIDIDASTLVDLDRPTLAEQQEHNSRVTAELTRLIREIEPEGVTVSVGGEIGEIGKGNSTPEDLRAFMTGYRALLPDGLTGISKVSIQTGTVHGGVVLADGSIAEIDLDFQTLEELSRIARDEYGLAGAVQHGASTLPDRAFDMFPKTGTAEVHLATGFQNLIFDSAHFPGRLLSDVNRYLVKTYPDERKPGETDGQLVYKTRKRAFGSFKRELWDVPAEARAAIREELEGRFSFLFRKLKVDGTTDLIERFVTRP